MSSSRREHERELAEVAAGTRKYLTGSYARDVSDEERAAQREAREHAERQSRYAEDAARAAHAIYEAQERAAEAAEEALESQEQHQQLLEGLAEEQNEDIRRHHRKQERYSKRQLNASLKAHEESLAIARDSANKTEDERQQRLQLQATQAHETRLRNSPSYTVARRLVELRALEKLSADRTQLEDLLESAPGMLVELQSAIEQARSANVAALERAHVEELKRFAQAKSKAEADKAKQDILTTKLARKVSDAEEQASGTQAASHAARSTWNPFSWFGKTAVRRQKLRQEVVD